MLPERFRQTAEDEDATEQLARLVGKDLNVLADFGRREQIRELIRQFPEAMRERFIAWLRSDDWDLHDPPEDIRRIIAATRTDETW